MTKYALLLSPHYVYIGIGISTTIGLLLLYEYQSTYIYIIIFNGRKIFPTAFFAKDYNNTILYTTYYCHPTNNLSYVFYDEKCIYLLRVGSVPTEYRRPL